MLQIRSARTIRRFWKVGIGVHVCNVSSSLPLTLPVTQLSSGSTKNSLTPCSRSSLPRRSRKRDPLPPVELVEAVEDEVASRPWPSQTMPRQIDVRLGGLGPGKGGVGEVHYPLSRAPVVSELRMGASSRPISGMVRDMMAPGGRWYVAGLVGGLDCSCVGRVRFISGADLWPVADPKPARVSERIPAAGLRSGPAEEPAREPVEGLAWGPAWARPAVPLGLPFSVEVYPSLSMGRRRGRCGLAALWRTSPPFSRPRPPSAGRGRKRRQPRRRNRARGSSPPPRP